MATENNVERMVTWSGISACNYCRYYDHSEGIKPCGFIRFDEKEGAIVDRDGQEITDGYYGAEVSTELYIKGCELLRFRGPQMPLWVHKKLPVDSQLRKVPPEQVISDFQKDFDLTPDEDISSEQVTELYETAFDAVRESLIKSSE